MSKHAPASPGEEPILEDGAPQALHPADRARPIPRISIQAFCDDPHVADALQYAANDRRLSKAHVSVHMGGIGAAVAHYLDSPTPNLIILDSALKGSQLLVELDRLAESCDPGTKVIVVGRHNDVLLYRELLKRGVAEYLVAPVDPMGLMESISNLYNNPDTDPVGQKSLTDFLIALLDQECAALGIEVTSPRDHGRRGGNVSFRSPGAGSVVEALIDQGVVSSFRKPDAIRFGVSPLVISHVDIHEAVMRLKRVLAENIWLEPKYKKVSV